MADTDQNAIADLQRANAALMAERDAALAREAALAEVLAAINAHPGDPTPVFQMILEKAHQLCGAEIGSLGTFDGQFFRKLVRHGYNDTTDVALSQPYPPRSVHEPLLRGESVHIRDTRTHQWPEEQRETLVPYFAEGGLGTWLEVPMFRDGRLCGTISGFRREPRAFSAQEISLLESFATQALIALENARLINEQREALEQQTATAEVLGVINASLGNLGPVFDTMLKNAMRLCDAASGGLFAYDGTDVQTLATRGAPPAFAAYRAQHPPSIHGSRTAPLIETRKPVHVLDVIDTDAYRGGDPGERAIVELGGARTLLNVPLLKQDQFVGFFSVYRSVVRGFSNKEIALLENFAAQAVIAMENARLITEQREALERQTATAEVLGVINANPGDLAPVFEAILTNAHRVCGFSAGSLQLWDGTRFRAVATNGLPAPMADRLREGYVPGPNVPPRRLVAGEALVHVPDLAEIDDPEAQAAAAMGGVRTFLGVALRRDNTLLGQIVAVRQEVQPFSDKQIALLQDFAAQAVIAMENARLITEQREALERQTAMAEVLAAINANPGNLTPVFDTILAKALTLSGSAFGLLARFEGERFRLAATRNVPLEYAEAIDGFIPEPGTLTYRLVQGEDVAHSADISADEAYRTRVPSRVAFVEKVGTRSQLVVALRRDGRLLGLICIFRTEVRAFGEAEISVLRSFADQAVIAMENARLLAEQAEALEQQTATADILGVISTSLGDVQPVFEKILESCKQIFRGDLLSLSRVDEQGQLQLAAYLGALREEVAATFPAPVELTPAGRAIREGRVVHYIDVVHSPDAPPVLRRLGQVGGIHSMIFAPMMWQGSGIGAVGVARASGPFSEREMEVLQTFAAQAVIAVENARLLGELRERTEALARRNSEFGERIEQQSATIDVLKVMSASPGDPQPVFNLIAERASAFCNAEVSGVATLDHGILNIRAYRGLTEEAAHSYKAMFGKPPSDASLLGRAVLAGRPMQSGDLAGDAAFGMQHLAAVSGMHSAAGVPMLRASVPIGAISLARSQTGEFGTTQMELLHTFAEQAVIAITSAESYRALTERTAELTRSVSELQALEETIRAVNSSLDLDTVLTTIINRAVQLSQADEGTIYEYDEADGVFVPKAAHGMSEDRVGALRERRIRMGETHLGRSAQQRAPVHVSDVQQDRALGDFLAGIHAVLAVPLLRDEKVIGGLVIRRRTAGDFAPTIPTLLQTFAGQSVLAIENARLFEQLAERGEEASRAREAAEAALEDLRKAQDRLVQTEKMASLGQLTAGIAHEIKNPLNFVNNFSDLSVDLLNELNEAVAPDKVALAAELRADIDEITVTLKGNLEKIAHHGRRADSIVKNMLLHSRTGASELRATDVNALAEEALNLAYHGARAEFPGFNITLERDFDPGIGMVELFPQEISRVLLNLVGNGFYATRKRAEQKATPGYEPSLRLSTRNLGDQIEIRVRDNGTGIPAELREKIFDPFFTTKPAGEGTGLGLSLSFDIIVKQHGGQLHVDSAPDEFTEFTITLPKTGAAKRP